MNERMVTNSKTPTAADPENTPKVPGGITTKLRAIRDALMDGLVERDVAVRLSLLAALAGEHLLMLGPPGTAKSLIARRLHLAFNDSTYFERLLTRFTVPEELFGPLSIKGLEEDRYERLTEAYLPRASIAFLDEIFKANSAILNALLTLLNEREFDNGTTRDKTPLVAVIGASNELPEGEELDALFDRFLLRLHVGPVTKEAFPVLLSLRGQRPPRVPDELRLHRHELAEVQAAADGVEVPEDVVALLCALRDWCTAEDIHVSDRRWRKIVKLLQVSAATNGRDRVSIWDCWLLQHCLWDTPEAREKVYAWYAARVGASAAMDPSHLTTLVTLWEAKLRADQENKSQMRDQEGHLLFKGSDGTYTTDQRGQKPAVRDHKALFLAPSESYTSDNGYGHNRSRIHDRTNGGHGYTQDELNALYVPERGYGLREFKHWSDCNSYLTNPNNKLIIESDLAPALEPMRHKEPYIKSCVGDLISLHEDVDQYRNRLLAHIRSLDAEIHGHLWITPEFAGPAAQNLARTHKDVEALLARIAKLRQGFEMLPKESPPPTATTTPQPKLTTKGRS